jgi:calcineurin-like phosphoesterase family protein
MTTFITSDTHFYHYNILRLSPDTRPYDDVDLMNSDLTNKWNKTIRPDDDVYHLGDLSFGTVGKTENIIMQLNGKIHLIKGNHDHYVYKERISRLFVWVKDYYELKGVALLPIVLFHYPIQCWNKQDYGAIHLHGHEHGTMPNIGRRYDVGIDGNDGYPYELKPLVDEITLGEEE